jgi:hypothetical protein
MTRTLSLEAKPPVASAACSLRSPGTGIGRKSVLAEQQLEAYRERQPGGASRAGLAHAEGTPPGPPSPRRHLGDVCCELAQRLGASVVGVVPAAELRGALA